MKSLFITVISLCCFLLGCASVALEPQAISNASKEFKQPNPNTAGIYVYRPSTIAGDGLMLAAYIDGECLGTTAPNTFLYKEVPGNRNYSIASESVVSPNELKIYISGGKNYFFRQTLTIEGLIAGIYTAKLTEVSENTGKEAIEDMKQSKTGKCEYDYHLNSLFD